MCLAKLVSGLARASALVSLLLVLNFSRLMTPRLIWVGDVLWIKSPQRPNLKRGTWWPMGGCLCHWKRWHTKDDWPVQGWMRGKAADLGIWSRGGVWKGHRGLACQWQKIQTGGPPSPWTESVFGRDILHYGEVVSDGRGVYDPGTWGKLERERIVIRLSTWKNKTEGRASKPQILEQEVVWYICLLGTDVANSRFANQNTTFSLSCTQRWGSCWRAHILSVDNHTVVDHHLQLAVMPLLMSQEERTLGRRYGVWEMITGGAGKGWLSIEQLLFFSSWR